MTASVAVSPRCIYPKTCGWRIEGQNAEDEARRHAGELVGGPHPPHCTVTEGVVS